VSRCSGKRREAHGVAGGERGVAEVLGDHGLADAGGALEQDVLAALDEIEGE
jgi:hypothetical protein